MSCTNLQCDGVDIVSGGGDLHHEGLGDDLSRPGHLADSADTLAGQAEPGPLLPHCQAHSKADPEAEEDCEEIFHLVVGKTTSVLVSSQSALCCGQSDTEE